MRSVSSRARLASVFLAGALLSAAVSQAFKPLLDQALWEQGKVEDRLSAAKLRASRFVRYEERAAEAKAKRLEALERSAQSGLQDSRQAVLEIRPLEKTLADAQAKGAPLRALDRVLAMAVTAGLGGVIGALTWFSIFAWRLESPRREAVLRGLWVVAPVLGVALLVFPLAVLLGEVMGSVNDDYANALALAAGGALVLWFAWRRFPERTERAFGGGPWDWKETGPARFWTYVRGPQMLLDTAGGLLLCAWAALTFFAGLTFIVVFPAAAAPAAGAAAGWTAVALAAIVPVVVYRRLPKPVAPADLSRSFLGLLVFAVAVRLLMWGGHSRHHAAFDALQADLKGRGLPVTLGEFQASVPAEQYGESAYAAALEKLDPKNEFNRKAHGSTGLAPWTKKTWDEEAAALARFEPAAVKELLPLGGRYSRLKKVDFLAAAKDPWSTPIPKLAGYIKAGHILRFCAEAHAYRKEPAKAWPYVRAQLDMADLIASERSLIGKMIAVALRAIAARAALVMALTAPELSLPKDLERRFESLQGARLIQEGLGSELASHLDARDWLERARYADRDQPSLQMLLGAETSTLHRLANYTGIRAFILMGGWDLNAAAVSRSLSGYAAAKNAAETRDLASREGLPFWPYFLADMAAPNWAKLFEKQWDLDAYLRFIPVVYALNAQKRATGRFPAAVSALDPYTERPFFYELKKDGYELCSAGPKGDRKDSRVEPFCVATGPRP